jgi:hypothetical protein
MNDTIRSTTPDREASWFKAAFGKLRTSFDGLRTRGEL